jgi:hypothetical protein
MLSKSVERAKLRPGWWLARAFALLLGLPALAGVAGARLFPGTKPARKVLELQTPHEGIMLSTPTPTFTFEGDVVINGHLYVNK